MPALHDVDLREWNHYWNRYENRQRYADDKYNGNRQMMTILLMISVVDFHDWSRQSMFHDVDYRDWNRQAHWRILLVSHACIRSILLLSTWCTSQASDMHSEHFTSVDLMHVTGIGQTRETAHFLYLEFMQTMVQEIIAIVCFALASRVQHISASIKRSPQHQ